MANIAFLQEFIILFGAALFVLTICNRLHIPHTIGFLITGMLIGPTGLKLIDNDQAVKIFAEYGVVFLLFTIGLELSLKRLRKMGKGMLLGGSIQVLSTIAAVIMISYWFGKTVNLGLYFGFIIVMNSTTIVLKLYQDRKELETPQGQIITSLQLFGDLMVVPSILVLPILSGMSGVTTIQLLIRFGGGLALIGLIFFMGRFLLPHFLHFIVFTRVRELLVLGSLFACLSGAAITGSLGFSLALGAFLAGILIAETDYQYQVQTEISSIRDIFNSIFFISIGMLINLNFAAHNLHYILLASLAVVLVKFITNYIAIASLQVPARINIIASASLSQIGEFSFVLISVGFGYKLLDYNLYQYSVSIIVMTMILTPYMINWAPLLFKNKNTLKNVDRDKPGVQLHNHVVIAGFGLTGQHISRVLTSANIDHIIMELNGRTVNEYKKQGVSIIFGDAVQKEILEKCQIKTASIFIPVISDAFALRKSIKLARQMQPDIYIIARSQRLDEIEELKQCGADQVIAQEFESSIEIVIHLMTKLNFPGNVIQIQSKLLREDGYSMMRNVQTTDQVSEKILRVLSAGTTASFLLFEEHHAAGKNIRQLDLRNKAGATIIAVVRGDKAFTNPTPELELQVNDVIVMMGSHAQIDAAFHFLETGK
ncbi:MAG TPA: cation:proton antiporter [bacterium]|nr:cation:proton antiporter [bacterium]HPN42336.1 cation:proton antiporter [bacterium]